MDGKSRDFREATRPNHPDYMDASELKKLGFSGIRYNSISNYIEVWLEGEKKFEVSKLEHSLDPESFERRYAELFCLYNVEQVPMKGN